MGGVGGEGGRRRLAEQDLRLQGEGSRDAEAALLVAGELIGKGIPLVGEADELEQHGNPIGDLPGPPLGEAHGQGDIVEGPPRGEQIVVAEDHADLAAPGDQAFALPILHDFALVDDLARGRPLQQIEAAQQQPGAGTIGPDETQDLAPADREGDVVQGSDLPAAAVGEELGQAGQAQDLAQGTVAACRPLRPVSGTGAEIVERHHEAELGQEAVGHHMAHLSLLGSPRRAAIPAFQRFNRRVQTSARQTAAGGTTVRPGLAGSGGGRFGASSSPCGFDRTHEEPSWRFSVW